MPTRGSGCRETACKAVVEIAANSEVEGPSPFGDGVLGIERHLFDVGVPK